MFYSLTFAFFFILTFLLILSVFFLLISFDSLFLLSLYRSFCLLLFIFPLTLFHSFQFFFSLFTIINSKHENTSLKNLYDISSVLFSLLFSVIRAHKSRGFRDFFILQITLFFRTARDRERDLRHVTGTQVFIEVSL